MLIWITTKKKKHSAAPKNHQKMEFCCVYSSATGAKVATKSVTLKVKGHKIISVSPKGVYGDKKTCHVKGVFGNKHVIRSIDHSHPKKVLLPKEDTIRYNSNGERERDCFV